MAINSKHITTVFARLERSNPQPETELVYACSYTLLIAVMLSAQTTDKQVNKCTEKLFARAASPQEMVTLSLEEVMGFISTLGLYKQKAKHVLATSQRLLDVYHGRVPDTREALETLPGVGRKTANVVLNVAFGQPTMPVDTHVFRVARRLGVSQGATPTAVEHDLLACVPKRYAQHAHHWLILHGRYTCKASKPLCDQCCLADVCPRIGVTALRRLAR